MAENRQKSFVRNYTEGVEKVKKGDYAFFMESTMIEYEAANDCRLTQIGGLLDSKGYGIGTPKGNFALGDRGGAENS